MESSVQKCSVCSKSYGVGGGDRAPLCLPCGRVLCRSCLVAARQRSGGAAVDCDNCKKSWRHILPSRLPVVYYLIPGTALDLSQSQDGDAESGYQSPEDCKSIPSFYECSVCAEVYSNSKLPLCQPCGHTVCCGCLENYITENNTKQCLQCKQSWGPSLKLKDLPIVSCLIPSPSSTKRICTGAAGTVFATAICGDQGPAILAAVSATGVAGSGTAGSAGGAHTRNSAAGSPRTAIASGRLLDTDDDLKKTTSASASAATASSFDTVRRAQKIRQIFVQDTRGRTSTLNVNGDELINTVKLQVEQTTGVIPEQQRLTFQGQNLRDGQRLSDYNIQNCDTMQLMARLRGGVNESPSISRPSYFLI